MASVSRQLRRHPFAGDAAVALALAVFVLVDVFGSADYLTASRWVYVPATLLMTLPLAWRRRAPLAVCLVSMAALIAESIAVGDAPTPDSQLPAWMLAVYTVAAHSERNAALVAGAVSLVAGIAWIGIGDFLLPVIVFGAVWLAGRAVRQNREHARLVEERAEALERAREADARAAAADERSRIARELHDVVGHSLAVIVVQAGAERLALGTSRSNPAEALGAIENTSREALAEMRSLVGMLRNGREPAREPTLADVESLAEQVRAAGVPVSIRMEGDPLTLPPAVAGPAYRIVQEALTNVLKHAGPARAEVTLRRGDNELEVVVSDDGRGARSQGSDGGHGLEGMRERARLLGGDLAAEDAASGGFTVRATLPLEAP